jgi:hypothetical protein
MSDNNTNNNSNNGHHNSINHINHSSSNISSMLSHHNHPVDGSGNSASAISIGLTSNVQNVTDSPITDPGALAKVSQ